MKLPEMLVSCGKSDSLLVVSDRDVHFRKRNRIVEKVVNEGDISSDKSDIVLIQTENKNFGPNLHASGGKAAVVVDLWRDIHGLDPASVQERLEKAVAGVSPKATVVLHSLTTLAKMTAGGGGSVAARMVNEARKLDKVAGVVAVGEADDRLARIEGSFSAVLRISRVEGSDKRLRCVVKHRPAVGKPYAKAAVLELTPRGDIVAVEDKGVVRSTPVTAPAEADAESDAMDKLTTFSLGLSEKEKEARNRVVMPFWKPEQKAAAAAKKEKQEEEEEEDVVRINSKAASANQGKIYYEPDEADDWDEEDPDDDLDF